MPQKGANKKKGKGKAPQGKGSSAGGKVKQEDAPNREQFISLPDRIANVKSFWKKLSAEERKSLLTVSVADVTERAKIETEKQQKQAAIEESLYPEDTITIDLEPTPTETLQLGLSRLAEKPTWKEWHWPDHDHVFLDAESFRTYVETERMSETMRALLPHDDGRPIERPAEANLRERMADLLRRVHDFNRNLQDQDAQNSKKGRNQRATTDQVNASIRDANVELIMMMMAEFETMPEHLYRSVLFPITKAVCELLDPQQRETKSTELNYEDFEKMHPDDVARFCEWLTEKVDGYSSKIKLEAKDLEEEGQEEGIGDVDLFTLVDDKEKGKSLVVNAKWLQHLQDRVLGDDGQPRKMKEGEDPNHIGLVLEWVYGTIVSTAEKARDGAKRLLGTSLPNVRQAFDHLDLALKDQKMWEEKRAAASEILARLAESRQKTRDYQKVYPDLYAPRTQASLEANIDAHSLPDDVILFTLNREILLTEAKTMTIDFEKYKLERELRGLKVQMRQGEPEFERLKREMEELKQNHRKMDGPFRSAQEMERHQVQAQDAQVHDQIQVQTQFREHSSKLQRIFDKRQNVEVDLSRKAAEERQLIGWRETTRKLVERFEEITLGPGTPPNGEESQNVDSQMENGTMDEETAQNHRNLFSAVRNTTGQEASLNKLRQHYHKDVRRQFYGDDDDKAFMSAVMKEAKAIDQILDDGKAVLQLLEMHLMNVACNDPGAVIGNQLILPMLQERLDDEARKEAEISSEKALASILAEEEDSRNKAEQDKAKKLEKKRRAEEKARLERERMVEETAKREEQDRTQASERARQEKEAAERIRLEKLEEEQREASVREAEMAARRRELGVQTEDTTLSALTTDPEGPASEDSTQIDESPQAPSQSQEGSERSKELLGDDDGFTQHIKQRKPRGPAQRPLDDSPPPQAPRQRFRQDSHRQDSRDSGRDEWNRRQEYGHNRGLPSNRHAHGRTIQVERSSLQPRSHNAPDAENRSKAESRASRDQIHRDSAHRDQRSDSQRRDNSNPSQNPRHPSRGHRDSARASPSKPADPPAQGTKRPAESAPSSSQSSMQGIGSAVQAFPATATPSPPAEQPAAASPAPEPAPPAAQAGPQGAPAVELSQPEPADVAPEVLPPPPPPPVPTAPALAIAQTESEEKRPEPGGDVPQPPAQLSQTDASMVPITPQQMIPQASSEPPSSGRPFAPTPVAVFCGKDPLPESMLPPQAMEATPSQMEQSMSGSQSHASSHLPVNAPYQYPEGPAGRGQIRRDGSSGYPQPPQQPGNHAPRGAAQQGARRHQGGHGPYDYQQQAYRQQQAYMQQRLQILGQPPQVGSGSYPAPNPAYHGMTGGQQPASHFPSMRNDYPGMPAGLPMDMAMPGRVPHAGQGQPVYGMGGPMGMQGGPQMPHPAAFGMPSPIMSQLSPSTWTMPSVPGPYSPQAQRMHPGMGRQMSTGGLNPPAMAYPSAGPPPVAHPGAMHLRQGSVETPRQLDNLSRRASQAGASLPSISLNKSGSLRAEAPAFVPGQPVVPASQPSMISQQSSQDTAAAAASQATPVAPPRNDGNTPIAASQQVVQPSHSQQSQQTAAERPAVKEDRSDPPPRRTESGSSASRPADNESGLQQPKEATSQAGTDRSGSAAETTVTERRLPSEANSSGTESSQSSSRTSTQKAAPAWSKVAAQAASLPQRDSKGNLRSDSSAESPARSKNKRNTLSPRNQSSASLKHDSEAESELRGQDSKDRKSARMSPLKPSDSPQTSTTTSTSGHSRISEHQLNDVTWRNISKDEIDRLSLVAGMENSTGTNNCFLNVIIQALWHSSAFRERFLALQPEVVAAKGGSDADIEVYRAVHSIFAEFEKLRSSLSDDKKEPKRPKLEGQSDAGSPSGGSSGGHPGSLSLVVSPQQLRNALTKHGFGINSMNDAAELLQVLLACLHKAEAGAQAQQIDGSLPVPVQIPANEANRDRKPTVEYGPGSVSRNVFGQELRVPDRVAQRERCGEKPSDKQAKRSRAGRGPQTDSWQDVPSRRQTAGPQPAPAGPRNPAERQSDVLDMQQYIQLVHIVPTQDLITDPRRDDTTLLNNPPIFAQSLGWDSQHAPAKHLEAVLKTMRPTSDLSQYFQAVPSPTPKRVLQAIVCFYGNHYVVYVYSQELPAWLQINDLAITKVGTYGDVVKQINESKYQPNVLLYQAV